MATSEPTLEIYVDDEGVMWWVEEGVVWWYELNWTKKSREF